MVNNNKIYNNIMNEIEKSKNIIITAHVNPDGDAVGAGLALMLSLKHRYTDKSIRFILQDEIPYTTKFLKYSETIEKFDETLKYEADLIIYVDSATIERTGKVGNYFNNIYKVNIDHHISNPYYGDINLLEAYISSTSEIIYDFLEATNLPLNIDIANSIYLGIVNDTGNFSHKNVTVNTMRIATKLMELGVDNNYIISNFLNSNSYQSLKILGDALSNFIFFEDVNLSFYYLDRETMNKYKAKKEDTEGLVEKILSYNKASVSLFLREDENNIIKGSMRSKNEIDVNKVANIFNGGGHIKAAGFSSKLDKEIILDLVKKEILRQKSE